MTAMALPRRALPVVPVLRGAARALASLALVVVAAVTLLAGIGHRVGAFRPIVVLGPSMGHTLPLGSVVVSTQEPAGAIRVGQIVSFRAPVGDHQVETHRVVRVVSAGPHPVVWTKGDANATRDPWTMRVDGSTVWVARTDIPYAGYALRALRSRAAHDLLVVAVPGLWAALGLWSLWAPGAPGAPAAPAESGAPAAPGAPGTGRAGGTGRPGRRVGPYRPAHRSRRRRAGRLPVVP